MKERSLSRFQLSILSFPQERHIGIAWKFWIGPQASPHAKNIAGAASRVEKIQDRNGRIPRVAGKPEKINFIPLREDHSLQTPEKLGGFRNTPSTSMKAFFSRNSA